MTQLPDFSQKLILLYLSNPADFMQNGVPLEKAEFKSFGNRLFLIGRVPDMGDEAWDSNTESAVAWDAVQSYLVFESKEDYLTRLKKAGKATKRFDA